MEYEVLKVYNNNVVLAKQDTEEVILLSKGIGFGKRKGDKLQNDEGIDKVFYGIETQAENLDVYSLKKRKKEIENVIRQIISIAESKIGILNANTAKALIEHIDFAIERLNMGLVIENPFINEIMSLYPDEYEIAEIAAKLIEENLGIAIGEEEKGFITLHLYSAKVNKTVKETMKKTRLYKECIMIIESTYNCKVYLDSSVSKEFLRALRTLMWAAGEHKKMHMPIKHYISLKMGESYKAALKIADLIEKEIGIRFSGDIVSFLAIEIEKLVQLL
ncbi:PRD domain-containing protein [Cellulosilyticum sp. I15G10I2]|uniref:PRD domain-containing protein n=1 Tax=Cellulosilyticum sp. I15G10I2 TaxID=1892843 RepID=UPI0014955313|nr:PRD domain-containing protein [Cellulosilyticum sp. I15G10I2]